MKICSVCKVEKPLTEFNKNKAKADGHGDKCRPCMKKYRKRHYRKNREEIIGKVIKRKMEIRDWLRGYKSNLVCSKCGERHPATIQFHHNDPSEKDRSIAEVVNLGWSFERIEKEISKCTVLCANCHSKEHWKENAELV